MGRGTGFAAIGAAASVFCLARDWVTQSKTRPPAEAEKLRAEFADRMKRETVAAQLAAPPQGYEQTTIQLAAVIDKLKQKA